MGDSAVEKFMKESFEKRPKTREKFRHLGASHKDPEQPISVNASLEVHYGTIASGDVLFKNAAEQDAVLN
jgi:PIN domain nuclease of toxin-antitoxin system